MQAGNEIEAKIRTAQIRTLKVFMAKQKIKKNDAVFLVGDLNIDHPSPQFDDLVNTLDLKLYPRHRLSHPYSVDPSNNSWVGTHQWPSDPEISREYPNGCYQVYDEKGECPCCEAQWLDYILVSTQHRIPKKGFVACLPVKVEPFETQKSYRQKMITQDLSDHFPVLGYFCF
jgi:endonuclease/exonuclease/phosphatase family metal-dependent hydrolase